MNSPQPPVNPPELLAPAGGWDCVSAAIENGADAVYFGLDSGFNARARAHNFGVEELPKLMQRLHTRGLRGYVTFNTLVFPGELEHAAEALTRIAESDVDAVLVQDLGIARLAREICPDLEVHASTQMTLSSAECIDVAQQLGIRRVVLPRELSIHEIRKISQSTDLPLEVFVHGALCVAYSGQCLTSESLGGRSANRGQCAQACRLPYELVVDGTDRELGDIQYLLSPQDLAAYELIPALMAAGVCSLKIEGRLKSAEYVANIVRHYRQAIDQALQDQKVNLTRRQVREMELSFSRGFSPGWLEGCDHKRLVPGDNSAKRGILIGEVVDVDRRGVSVRLRAEVARGDGVAFAGNRVTGADAGGRVYDIFRDGMRVDRGTVEGGIVELVFAEQHLDLSKLYRGQQVWKTDDPQLNKRLRASYSGADPVHRMPIDLSVRVAVGQPPSLTARTPAGIQVTVIGDDLLEPARRHPVTEESLHSQFDRLGGTPFRLRKLEAEIIGDPMLPHSVTGVLRKKLVAMLGDALQQPKARHVDPQSLVRLQASLDKPASSNGEASPTLWALCRSMEQIQGAIDAGIRHLYADFHDIRQYSQAVQIAKQASTTIFLATLRIQKPGEIGLTRKLLKHQPDGLLVRNLAALQVCRQADVPAVVDFSLNIANQLSAQWIRELGSLRSTISYDLNRDQIGDLIEAVPGEWLEAVIHQHMPMFHMEHCVFCAVISPGTNKTNCGRPCDVHQVKLRDRVGMEHPLQADVGCRNTLFNAVPQSSAEIVPLLLGKRVSHFRIEFLEERREQVGPIVDIYCRLLSQQVEPSTVWKQLKAANRVGVTRGTLEERRNPLAIL